MLWARGPWGSRAPRVAACASGAAEPSGSPSLPDVTAQSADAEEPRTVTSDVPPAASPEPSSVPPAPGSSEDVREAGALHAVLAGVVSAVVGFTSSFAVVLTGLQHVGASGQQAASGLLILCLTMGAGCILFSWGTRMPMTMAWSTPGAALLTSTAAPEGGFAATVGAFCVVGILIALCGWLRPLERAVEAIPAAVANAMLAGVLLGLCAQPFRDVAGQPWAIGPVILVWALCMRFARRWAVPAALLAAVGVMIATGSFARLTSAELLPRVEFVAPVADPAAIVSVAIPVWLVTMTSQNIPGMAVLRSFGYRPTLRRPMLYTGAATAAGAFGGAHAINLSAIAAALVAGPDGHPDPRRRWIGGVSCGAVYMLFGPLSGAVAAIAAAAPPGLLAAIAGLALVGTLAGSAAAALADPTSRDAAALTFVVAASGLVIGGVGAAFWGLLAGLAWTGLMRLRWAPSAAGRHRA